MAEPVTDPRALSLDVLAAVRERDAYATLLLPSLLERHRLSRRDRAFATDLVYGTLRWQGQLDLVIDACSSRPRLDPPVREVLRLAAYQLLHTATAQHAAVSTAVDLARERTGKGAAGFVNAVLRAVSRRSLPEWLDRVAPAADVDPIGHRVAVYSHPRWIVEALGAAVAASAADADVDAVANRIDSLLQANNTPATTTLAARPPWSTVAELCATGAQPGLRSPLAARLPRGNPADVPAVAEGRAGVQDEGSQLMALALARARVRGPAAEHGAPWLDLCAGPGGKAALLASLAATSTTTSPLLALEPAGPRVALVRRATARAGASAAAVRADGTRPPLRPGTFARVLVDAPCTGLGALRRRPDSRWRRQPDDVAPLVELQGRLLQSALDLAMPGGVVAYTTCSPHLAETVEVIEGVRASRDDIEVVPAPELLPEVAHLSGGPYAQLWPDLHDTDAMFLAVLRRCVTPD